MTFLGPCEGPNAIALAPEWIGLSWRGAGCYPASMLELAEVNRMVKKVASANFKRPAGVRRVFSQRAADSEGEEALRITIVLKPDGLDKISGDMVLDTLVGIGKALRAANDERFPIIDYATEEDLESRDDAES